MNKRLTLSFFGYLLSLVLLILVGTGVFFYWALGSSLPQRSTLAIEEGVGLAASPKDILTVSSYNIGHGQGIKERAWDYRDKETTMRQLNEVANAMVDINADLFLLQEVDLDSSRTFHIDQIQFIKQKTKHPFHACAIVWQKNYLPFPYWPPAHHLGHVKSANCVLSRYPLSNHERLIFDKPKSNPFWYNWGYIDRGIQRVDVDIEDKSIAVLNLHLEAWDKSAREDQIKVTNQYIKEIDLPVILGGDFNTVPPKASKLTGFLDDPEADYKGEETFLWFFANAKNLKIAKLKTSDDPFEQFTFPSDQPDRRLDHIFLFGRLSFVDFYVQGQAKTASDHLPVVAKIKIN